MTIAQSIKSAFDLVWHQPDSILENSDSILILGNHSGPALDRLKRIASKLQGRLGYGHTSSKNNQTGLVSVGYEERPACPKIIPPGSNPVKKLDSRPPGATAARLKRPVTSSQAHGTEQVVNLPNCGSSTLGADEEVSVALADLVAPRNRGRQRKGWT